MHGRLAAVVRCGVEGGKHLFVVVATAAQGEDVVVAHLGHHLQRARVTPKEVFAHKAPSLALKAW
jgi:hypothetical protein